jgi:hypothetical protein
MARICRHSAILVRPHARTLLHDLRVYQLAPKADEHGFGFPRLLALSCRAPMARPSPLWKGVREQSREAMLSTLDGPEDNAEVRTRFRVTSW